MKVQVNYKKNEHDCEIARMKKKPLYNENGRSLQTSQNQMIIKFKL